MSMHAPRRRAGPLTGALALILGFAVASPPALAAEAAAAEPARTTLAQAAAAKVAAMDPLAVTASTIETPATQATSPERDEIPTPKKPFFKTGKGIAAAALMAGGLVITFVSFGNDRVKSPSK
jgi:hypothetical protein